ncbi:MAG: putative sigma-54 modulation protein [Colwellia sp.]|jgi:putative sigma-54 modulation protein
MELTITNLKIELSTENLLQIRQKTRRMFNKFYDRVQVIKVTIDDINGPRGGKDKNCRVVIYSKGMPDIVVSDNQNSVMLAVNIALSRARLSFLKKVKRQQKNYPTWSPKNDIELSTRVELERMELIVN